jgi:hypothetical protein
MSKRSDLLESVADLEATAVQLANANERFVRALRAVLRDASLPVERGRDGQPSQTEIESAFGHRRVARELAMRLRGLGLGVMLEEGRGSDTVPASWSTEVGNRIRAIVREEL